MNKPSDSNTLNVDENAGELVAARRCWSVRQPPVVRRLTRLPRMVTDSKAACRNSRAVRRLSHRSRLHEQSKRKTPQRKHARWILDSSPGPTSKKVSISLGTYNNDPRNFTTNGVEADVQAWTGKRAHNVGHGCGRLARFTTHQQGNNLRRRDSWQPVACTRVSQRSKAAHPAANDCPNRHVIADV